MGRVRQKAAGCYNSKVCARRAGPPLHVPTAKKRFQSFPWDE